MRSQLICLGACCACGALGFTPNVAMRATEPVKGVVRRSRELSTLARDILWGPPAAAAGKGGVLSSVLPALESPPLEKAARADGKSPHFEVNLGKVIDTLRSDYVTIFDEPLDFSIYEKDVVVQDPTGVAFRGINTYRRLFGVLRFFKQMFMSQAQTRFRINYDWTKEQVRVKWHAILVPKSSSQPLFLDGVSVYSLTNEGMVRSHHLETIIVNGTPVTPPFAYAWLNLPAWVGAEEPSMVPGGLASASAAPVAMSAAAMPADNGAGEGNGMVMAASQSSGESEKKQAPRARRKEKKSFGNCETSWDCENPRHTCCDFVFAKICCNSGLGSPAWAPELVPIPVPVDDYPPYGY